jgi:NAD(P)-dependent dehydrogenase (short-subunit alcohol dehydrogenase family)
MRCMITGGNRGLGLTLCQQLNGDSYSRENNYDITKDRNKLAKKSLEYDVFINNAFDGPFQESWADFGQVKLLYEVAVAWQKNNKTGHIINIGSSGSEDIVAPEPSWETYRVNKAALKHHSQQWTRAFKSNQVLFRTSLITVDRLDTPLSRSRATWTGNGVDLEDVVDMINLCLSVKSNTCIGEIKAWVNLNHKQQ